MNKKIKIIDLLCLISNGEEVPKKIKYAGTEYEFSGYDTASKNYKCEYEGGFYSDLFSDIDGSCLNNEVEILDDKEYNPKTLKFGDEIILTRTNCDDIQGFIISAKGIEPIEDKDIPLIPDDELYSVFDSKEGINKNKRIDYNFKVLKEKINQVVEEFNVYRREHNE